MPAAVEESCATKTGIHGKLIYQDIYGELQTKTVRRTVTQVKRVGQSRWTGDERLFANRANTTKFHLQVFRPE